MSRLAPARRPITTHNRKRDHFYNHRGPLQHMHMLLSNSIGPCPIGDGPLSVHITARETTSTATGVRCNMCICYCPIELDRVQLVTARYPYTYWVAGAGGRGPSRDTRAETHVPHQSCLERALRASVKYQNRFKPNTSINREQATCERIAGPALGHLSPNRLAREGRKDRPRLVPAPKPETCADYA